MTRSRYPVKRPPRPTARGGGSTAIGRGGSGPRRPKSGKSGAAGAGAAGTPPAPPRRPGPGPDAVALQAKLLEERERERTRRRAVAEAAGGPRYEAYGLPFEVSRAVWTAVPVASLGLATPLPMLRRACLLRDGRGAGAFTGFLTTTVLAWVTVSVSPLGSTVAALGILLLLVSTAAGSLYTYLTFRETCEEAEHAPTGPGGPTVEERNRRAVRDARSRMRLRAQARRIAERDPALARELGIGRPDQPPAQTASGPVAVYDDGGLLDVNAADARQLVRHLGLTGAQAETVVRERERLGGRYASPQELAVYGGLPDARVAELADRLLFVRAAGG